MNAKSRKLVKLVRVPRVLCGLLPRIREAKNGVKQLVHFCLSIRVRPSIHRCQFMIKELENEPVVQQYFGSDFILIAQAQGGVR